MSGPIGTPVSTWVGTIFDTLRRRVGPDAEKLLSAYRTRPQATPFIITRASSPT